MIRRPPRSTLDRSSAASDVYKRQIEYNLRMANLSTIDKIEPLPRVFYEKWWDDFVNEGSVSIRAMWIIILLFSALAQFALYLFVNKIVIRKVSFFLTIGLISAALFT